MTATNRHRVVVVGGGFGGLECVRSLRDAPVNVTLIERTNYHLFQPLLYQVATGGLSPANIAAPLRGILRGQRNVRVLQAEVAGFRLDAREVETSLGAVPYDTLVVAAGSRHDYFGHPEWEEFAPGLKTIEDAVGIRARVFSALERADAATDPTERKRWLTFVVVGGGPTGVELAGQLGEIAHDTLRRDFPDMAHETTHVVLIEAGERVLSAFNESLSRRAEHALEHLGVSVRTHTFVTGVDGRGVEVTPAGDGTEPARIEAGTVLWGAGMRASGLASLLAGAAGLEVDRAGRVPVGPDLTLAGHPEVVAIGDMASAAGEDGRPLAGLATVALQQGAYAARLVGARLEGRVAAPFRYRSRGTMATIGRGDAVAQIGPLRFWGFPGWVLWLGVHLMQLVSFQNRALVLVQWAWHYVTRSRSARLIVGRARLDDAGRRGVDGTSSGGGASA